MSTFAGHDWSSKPKAEEEDDPVENMIKKTGCIELHYKIQVIESVVFA